MKSRRQYILALVIAHRTFAPRLWSTVAALALIAAFIALGRWQLARADYKRALIAALLKRAIGIAARRARGERVEAGHEYAGR